MTLLRHHQDKLQACGLSSETIARAQLHSGSANEVREILGYGGAGPGLVIPYPGCEGYARVRIDNPGPDGKRYRSPKGSENRLYVPPDLPGGVLDDPSRALYLTEGEFKALKATQEGFPTLALPGVWSWKTRLHGRSMPIPDLGRVAWRGRNVIVVFDSDLADKPPVAWAEHQLCEEIRRRSAHAYVLRLPPGPRGEKWGVDDYLVSEGARAFARLSMETPEDSDKTASPFLRVRDLADAYVLRALEPHGRITLGYSALDVVLRGIAPGEVMTILGRTGVGKTAWALNLIEGMTASGALPTLLFSLEQPALEIFERMASLTVGWPGREIEERTRTEDPEVVRRLLDVAARWDHVVVVERPCTIEDADKLVEQAKAKEFWSTPLKLVVVDYLGLIAPRRPGLSPYEHMSATARDVKGLAKRHRISVIALGQVHREGGTGGEPVTLTMARESGVVEEAADYLLGIWRPELQEGLTKEKRAALRGQFKVRVLKNRHGPAPRTVALRFEPTNLRVTAELSTTTADEEPPAWVSG